MLIVTLLAVHFSGFTRQPAVNEHLTYGMPAVEGFGRKLIVREGYTLLHDDEKKDPIWVSYRLTKVYTTQAVPRKDQFAPDPLIEHGHRAELADYKRVSKLWSRGHMAPANDMRRSATVQRECFFLTNMVPQNQTMNAGIWSRLEAKANSYAKAFGDITIITGPIFDKPMPGGGTAPEPVGDNRIAVPTWLYKIVIRKLSGGGYAALAFELPNQKLTNTDEELKKYLVPIRQIESETHLNFLNALPVDVQNRMETTAASSLWTTTNSTTPKPKRHKNPGE